MSKIFNWIDRYWFPAIILLVVAVMVINGILGWLGISVTKDYLLSIAKDSTLVFSAIFCLLLLVLLFLIIHGGQTRWWVATIGLLMIFGIASGGKFIQESEWFEWSLALFFGVLAIFLALLFLNKGTKSGRRVLLVLSFLLGVNAWPQLSALIPEDSGLRSAYEHMREEGRKDGDKRRGFFRDEKITLGRQWSDIYYVPEGRCIQWNVLNGNFRNLRIQTMDYVERRRTRGTVKDEDLWKSYDPEGGPRGAFVFSSAASPIVLRVQVMRDGMCS